MGKLALGESDRGDCRVDTSELHGIAASEIVHGLLAQVDTRRSMINGGDEDALAVVGDLEALAAGSAVPAGNVLPAADVGERRDGTLSLVAVAGDEAVGTVGAGDGGHGARLVVITGVVGDGDGGSGRGEDSKDGAEGLHLDG